METIKIVITKEDFASRVTPDDFYALYTNSRKCPLAVAIMKAGITDKPLVGTSVICEFVPDNEIGNIYPEFGCDNMLDLITGKITEFVTTYTPYDRATN